jgi:hypothetical protein
MSKESSSETTLINTFLAETEKVIREELPKAERDEVIAKLKKRWEFLTVRSYFDEFLKSYKLKSLEAAEIFEVKRFMAEVFADEKVALEPDETNQTLTITVQTEEEPLEGKFTVEPPNENENPVKVAFIPFVACLKGDPGVVWVFGRSENLSESEARIALNESESEFWATKKGLKLVSKGCPKTFEAFVEHVPAGLLKNRGLKRHYKTFGIVTAVDAHASDSAEPSRGSAPVEPPAESSTGEAATPPDDPAGGIKVETPIEVEAEVVGEKGT